LRELKRQHADGVAVFCSHDARELDVALGGLTAA
jgi:hypothetical protein